MSGWGEALGPCCIAVFSEPERSPGARSPRSGPRRASSIRSNSSSARSWTTSLPALTSRDRLAASPGACYPSQMSSSSSRTGKSSQQSSLTCCRTFKFARPGTTVVLRADASVERVLIEVEDECRGLASGDLNELFRPFEQRGVDRTGLGLGLAFSRWGVEQNNGKVYARNLTGKGCVFTVDLPRVAVAAVASV